MTPVGETSVIVAKGATVVTAPGNAFLNEELQKDVVVEAVVTFGMTTVVGISTAMENNEGHARLRTRTPTRRESQRQRAG
jgi:hypothetical protein